ncbi:MAG TPA: cytochrome c maturation protein CcmE [Alphaproteobacteria bacterium]
MNAPMTAKNRPKQRLKIILLAGFALGAAVALSAYGLRGYATYFHSPSDLVSRPPQPDQYIRLGGMVVDGSIDQQDTQPPSYAFTLTDHKAEINVTYQGILPDLFRDGQGVVVEGKLPQPGEAFIATRVLAKHDEYYMPREVERALKK